MDLDGLALRLGDQDDVVDRGTGDSAEAGLVAVFVDDDRSIGLGLQVIAPIMAGDHGGLTDGDGSACDRFSERVDHAAFDLDRVCARVANPEQREHNNNETDHCAAVSQNVVRGMYRLCVRMCRTRRNPPGLLDWRMIGEEPQIKILFVEDDERLANLTRRYLEGTGFQVTWESSGASANELVRHGYDVVLLDLMLPGQDGIEICRNLRTQLDVPIIMVTARREEADRVLGLDSGADDYVTKPFSSRELVARIRAVVRRARGRLGPAAHLIQAGDISLDPQTMRVTVEGRDIRLTGYEFALLRVLAERVGRVLSREQLLDLARYGGAEEAFERSIDIQISKLRAKLGDDARNPRFLKTVRGSGYLLAGRR